MVKSIYNLLGGNKMKALKNTFIFMALILLYGYLASFGILAVIAAVLIAALASLFEF
jgi:hypothetical protein